LAVSPRQKAGKKDAGHNMKACGGGCSCKYIAPGARKRELRSLRIFVQNPVVRLRVRRANTGKGRREEGAWEPGARGVCEAGAILATRKNLNRGGGSPLLGAGPRRDAGRGESKERRMREARRKREWVRLSLHLRLRNPYFLALLRRQQGRERVAGLWGKPKAGPAGQWGLTLSLTR